MIHNGINPAIYARLTTATLNPDQRPMIGRDATGQPVVLHQRRTFHPTPSPLNPVQNQNN